MGGTLIS